MRRATPIFAVLAVGAIAAVGTPMAVAADHSQPVAVQSDTPFPSVAPLSSLPVHLAGNAARKDSSDTDYSVSVSSESPLPTTLTVAALNALYPADQATTSRVRAHNKKHRKSKHHGAQLPGVRARTATPGGFSLRNPGTRSSDYVYKSDKIYQASYLCDLDDGECELESEVTAHLKEQAIGGSSHTWELTLNYKEVANPFGLTWTYHTDYWCGVNVSLSDDYECDNGAAPSGVSMSHNTIVNKPWGGTNNITVFPMVSATTQFSNGKSVTTKFRGWDTLSRATTTKLKASSDG